ncbi:hypothetical protein GYA37_02745 [candidate division WWE3 bacterium]|uniref:Uncharacterized protein n=1 Tax=candidate division WWE3 bacterium TaxID=2053526 RepID=A0A7X9E777_UNCKA|nr:hypothetical protein [candidate division WWE3 bacterium]
METLQIILTISLIVFIVSLTAVSLYLIFVLKDIKETAENVKEISKIGKKITSSLAIPMTTVMGIAGGISKGLKTIRSIVGAFEDEDDYDEEEI